MMHCMFIDNRKVTLDAYKHQEDPWQFMLCDESTQTRKFMSQVTTVTLFSLRTPVL